MTRTVILVPYRDTPGQDRAAQLARFMDHFSGHEVLIIEQSQDGRKFNRGALLNAGVKMVSSFADVVVLHDVDLLPDAAMLKHYGKRQVVHLARPWKKYNYEKFFGGVVGMTVADYERSGGFPNNYWGWGGEDDVFRARVVAAGLKIALPADGSYVDTQKNWTQDTPAWKNLKKPVPHGNVRDVRYTVLERTELAPDTVKVTINIS